MVGVYNAALAPLRLVAEAWALRHARGPRATEWSERMARRLPHVARPGAVWVHGASVGEARIVSAIAKSLRARGDLPVVVSCVTPTGRAQLPGVPDVDAAFFLPLDFPGLPTRVLRAVAPGVLTLVETELWPNLLREAQSIGVPVVLVNARLSAGRMRWYRRAARWLRPLLARLTAVGARAPDDAERFRELGVPASKIRVTGNVKYDLGAPASDRLEARSALGVSDDRPVLVAGSTRPGEEKELVEALVILQRDFRDLLLVLAPRHPERVPEIERVLADSGIPFTRGVRTARAGDAGISALVIDRLGLLGTSYFAADVAFVGGTLVPIGGHNVLEPAAAAVPVLFGPHTANVADEAEALVRAGGALFVSGARDLADASGALLRDRARARAMGRAAHAVVASNRGALARTIEMILAARVAP